MDLDFWFEAAEPGEDQREQSHGAGTIKKQTNSWQLEVVEHCCRNPDRDDPAEHDAAAIAGRNNGRVTTDWALIGSLSTDS